MTNTINAQGDNNIGGDIVGRDKIVNNITQYIQIAPFTPPPDLTELKRAYLTHLRRMYRALDFKGIPQFESVSRELLLEEVYVPLLARPELPRGETWERRLAGRDLDKDILPEEMLAQSAKVEAELRPLPVEETLGKQPRVVVLGDPGSGKSTLLKYLALRLAVEPDAPLPILLSLNAYALALENGDVSLQAYLPQHFAALAQGLSNLQPLFDTAIANGQALILLDGLDEVQSENLRHKLTRNVEAFAAEVIQRGSKLVVTSRIVGYRESPLNTKNWSLYTLLDFDRDAQQTFANKWCMAFERSTLGDTPLARTNAATESHRLLDSLYGSIGVAQLASNPLLLTILALIQRQGVSLPNRRVELYELYLRTLISAWNKARALDKTPVGQPLDYLETIAVLAPLALWLRQDNPTAGLVTEERLLEWLTRFYMSEEYGKKKDEAMRAARGFFESVRKYSNVLLERGAGRYGFIHLTFEEALAARGVVQAGQLDLAESIQIFKDHVTDPEWRETLLLAIGVWGLVREEPLRAGKVLQAVLQQQCEKAENILLAGACLEDVGERGMGRATAYVLIDALEKVSFNRALSPTVQRDAGFVLGRLAGANAEFLQRIRPDLDDWVEIPEGWFLYGDDNHKEVIEKPFLIAKYPVTNLQYKRFMVDGGYQQKEFWSEHGWVWANAEKLSEPQFWHDSRFNNPLAPVVGVTWYEAEAYTHWLAQKENHLVRLPTEQEWERAARGTAGRVYAWDHAFNFNRANSAAWWQQKDDAGWYEGDDDSPTLVGQFYAGHTPDGIGDMTGNVWEWTFSWYNKKLESRVLRGGGFSRNQQSVRCANRLKRHPVNRAHDRGFRLCAPPIKWKR